MIVGVCIPGSIKRIMDEVDKQWMADLSLVVRESTLKRLQIVPNGLENWRYKEGKMSFSDLACHLIECDKWMFETLNHISRAPILESHFTSHSRADYDGLLDDLARAGQERASLIRSYTQEDYRRMIHDPRVGQ